AHYKVTIAPGETTSVGLRLSFLGTASTSGSAMPLADPDPWSDFDEIFSQRQAEADEFYAALQPKALTEDEKLVQRQVFAGLLWSKQFYHYNVAKWLQGDPNQPPPSTGRKHGRNSEWAHIDAADIISMPDKWEYPWFAAWDLAFHCVPMALVDPEFAKEQMILLGREWYQHPNGQVPAYEWAFGDVNPPTRAWAVWRVYKIDQKMNGISDIKFLERTFHKLLLTFTWWVNRKDADGMNVFQGGFLGLDNIGVFDRSAPLPTGGHIEQSDGTSWMGAFCLNMLTISLELARYNTAYEDIATKFFEHFLRIAGAMNNIGGEGISLWDEEDEFFYDVLHVAREDGDIHVPLKVRSMVGLTPLFAVITVEPELLDMLPDFKRRALWLLDNRPDQASMVSRWEVMGMKHRRLLALLRGHRMKRLLRRMLDESEFLSPYGIRALSRHHAEQPYVFETDGARYTVEYQPGESNSGLFGGNSNWRGPIWFPVNYLIVEALQQFHNYYGDDFKVECPTGAGQFLTLNEIADELSKRLIGIFTRDATGRRAVFGEQEAFQRDPHWGDYIPFYEYFHGDSGRGVGASHQTGWTGLVA
ncbi:MAG: glucosidase, partial [Chloroflexia bacterium]